MLTRVKHVNAVSNLHFGVGLRLIDRNLYQIKMFPVFINILIVTYTQVYREHFDKFKNVCFKNWQFCNVLNIDVVLKTE